MASERINPMGGGVFLQRKDEIWGASGQTIDYDMPPGIYRYMGNPTGKPDAADSYGVLIVFAGLSENYNVQILVDGSSRMFYRFNLKETENEWKQVTSS